MATEHVLTERPWYQHITIDLLILVLRRTLFHPFLAWMLPLSLLAQGTPYQHLSFLLTTAYASLLTLLYIVGAVNHRVAYGEPRKMHWEEEVVVITGGSSGLGRVIADMYGMRGVSVAVLDVNPFYEGREDEEEGKNIHWFRCDVGDPESIEKAKILIEEQLGTPTILINNAGVVNGLPLLSLPFSAIEKNFRINLLAHYATIQAFLPSMLRRASGGTIVTISSVLGHLGASHLSDYTAAKAGLFAMHASLRAELAALSAAPDAPAGAKEIKTILVKPGQLSTPLFRGVQTPSNFFGPVVEPVELAKEIVRMIDAGESGELAMPFYARWIEWMTVLPAGLQRGVRWASGIDRAMLSFDGKVIDGLSKKSQ